MAVSNIVLKLLQLAGMVLLVVTTACEEDIQPFAPGYENLHYSLWGYLDASADTQWIRVTPVRDSILTEPGELDAIVTLEHLESGETYVLNDSIFQFQAFGLEGAPDTFVHNFWTDAPIEFGQTYQLSVVGPDGETTSAIARIPEDIESIVVRLGSHVQVNNAEHLAMVVQRHYMIEDTDDCSPTWPRVWARNKPLEKLEPGIWWAREITYGYGSRPLPCREIDQDILVVASGVEWLPHGFEYSINAPTEHGFPSNVENGLGHVAGVVSKVVPVEICGLVHPINGSRAVCSLTYLDEESATLQGTITAAACEGGPAVLVQVRLREILDHPTQRFEDRRESTNANGFYRIEALDPEKTYQLLLPHTHVDTLFIPQDTLQLEPMEEVTLDLALGSEYQNEFCEYP